MTEYTLHPDALFDSGAPILGSTQLEARDNLLALAEGDATAPSMYPGLASKHVLGAIGTTATLSKVGTVVADTSYAGSLLKYGGIDFTAVSPFTATGGAGAVGETPAGTWRALGTVFVASANNFSVTSYIRIA